MILILLLGILIPLPLAIHFLYLASLNRRPHPVLVGGGWDFAEVLFAASGFLIFGGPCVLAGFNQRYRDSLLAIRTPRLAWPSGSFWVALWVAYFVAVVAVAAYVLWRRRLATEVYNVAPGAFFECLDEALSRLKVEWVRSGDLIFLNERQDGEAVDEADPYRRRLTVQVDIFPATRHVTLYWPEDAGPLRAEIEAGLTQTFATAFTRDNPVGIWMLTLSLFFFAIPFFTVAFLMFVLMRLLANS